MERAFPAPDGWVKAVREKPSRPGFKEHVFRNGTPVGCRLTDGRELTYGTAEYRQWAGITVKPKPLAVHTHVLRKVTARKDGINLRKQRLAKSREGWVCCVCDATHTDQNPITNHHLFPFAWSNKVGIRNPGVLARLCSRCHCVIHKIADNRMLGQWFNTEHALRLLVRSKDIRSL